MVMATARITFGTDGTICVEFSDVEGLNAHSQQEVMARKARLDALFDRVVKLDGITNVTIEEVENDISQCSMIVCCTSNGDVEMREVGKRLWQCVIGAFGALRMVRIVAPS